MDMRIIKFSNLAKFFIPLSIILIVASWVVTYSFYGGFNYGIDFAGGVKIRASFLESVSTKDIKDIVSKKVGITPIVQRIGKKNDFIIVTKFNFKEEKKVKGAKKNKNEVLEENPLVKAIKSAIESKYKVKWLETKYVGPTIGKKYRKEAITISLMALLFILIYIAFRFQFRFAVAAIIPLFHDSLMTLGFLGVTRIELDVSIVAAILTIIGYSLNDTIVVFDRIRENMNIYRGMDERKLIDLSITQSLSRTIITSLTTAFVVAVLLVVGVVVDMNLTLLVGIIVGTYSSIYIASPIVLYWDEITSFYKKRKRTKTSKKKGR